MSTQPNTTDLDRQRAEFEAWAEGYFMCFVLHRAGDGYAHTMTQAAWEAWQAATQQAAREQQEPVAWAYECLQPGGMGIWAEFLSRQKPSDASWVRNVQPLFAAPVAQQSEAVRANIPTTASEELRLALIELTATQRKLIDANAELITYRLAGQQTEAGSIDTPEFRALFTACMESADAPGDERKAAWSAFVAHIDSRPTCKQSEAGAPTASAEELRKLTRERDGWKEEAQHQKALHESACRQVELLKEYERGHYWLWHGDGSDNLHSMSNGMGVLIRADKLRAIMAQAGRESAAPGAQQDAILEHLKAAREAVRRVMADLSVLHEDKPEEMAATIALTATLVSGDLELAANSIDAAMQKGAQDNG